MPYTEKPLRNGQLDSCLSEDWLLANLPDGWTYDCQVFGGDTPDSGPGFIIFDRNDITKQLFIPLSLLAEQRHA
jgi:hypothetical protein